MGKPALGNNPFSGEWGIMGNIVFAGVANRRLPPV